MIRRILLACLLAAGCEPVTNLDIHYLRQATGEPSNDGGADGEADATPPATCPCDSTQGLGCCLRADAGPVCAPTAAECGGGVFVACIRADPLSESACCWSNVDGTRVAAFGTVCGTRPSACATDGDCAGAKCEVRNCYGVLIGACGDPPPCP
jgi:hypothetical protein